jgi:DNA-binding GntR family transcriptional regulator
MTIVRPLRDRTTLQEEAYRALRSAIIGRRIPSGTKLIVRALAEQLRLSPTPIKGALAALEREGLVTAIPHRGYFIPRISAEDIEEIYALREVVDGLAARLAASRADEHLIQRLRNLVANQRDCIPSENFERYGDLDLAFHKCIREASGNRRLLKVAEAFDGQVRLLIDTSTRARTLPISIQEHEAITEAIEARDPIAAETAMQRHVRAAGIALQEKIRRDPAVQRTHV